MNKQFVQEHPRMNVFTVKSNMLALTKGMYMWYNTQYQRMHTWTECTLLKYYATHKMCCGSA
jgi:hypothetical protein